MSSVKTSTVVVSCSRIGRLTRSSPRRTLRFCQSAVSASASSAPLSLQQPVTVPIHVGTAALSNPGLPFRECTNCLSHPDSPSPVVANTQKFCRATLFSLVSWFREWFRSGLPGAKTVSRLPRSKPRLAQRGRRPGNSRQFCLQLSDADLRALMGDDECPLLCQICTQQWHQRIWWTQ